MNINHVLVQTTDLTVMSTFLQHVTGLKEGFRPPFPFPGIWIYSEGKPLLHLVEIAANGEQADYLGLSKQDCGAGAFDHVALEGADYTGLIARLETADIDYTERTVPLTKEHQVFIIGPDNVKLEMIFSEDKARLISNSH